MSFIYSKIFLWIHNLLHASVEIRKDMFDWREIFYFIDVIEWKHDSHVVQGEATWIGLSALYILILLGMKNKKQLFQGELFVEIFTEYLVHILLP